MGREDEFCLKLLTDRFFDGPITNSLSHENYCGTLTSIPSRPSSYFIKLRMFVPMLMCFILTPKLLSVKCQIKLFSITWYCVVY